MTPEHLRAEADMVDSETGTDCTTRAALLRGAADELDRLYAWIQRTASDDNLKHRAGYHGRRVMLEAAAVMCGQTIPKKVNQ